MLRVLERNQAVNQQDVLSPLTQVLEEITPAPIKTSPLTVSPSTAKSIQELFPEQEYEEKDIQKAKEILGKLASNFTKEETRDLVAQIKYLAESWVNEFERDLFDGKTLNELLHERGGL